MKDLSKLKAQKWLVAVSGGSDSMALLSMCQKAGIDICVAHVNYNKRESAKRDMRGVEAFCAQYQIPCFVYFVENYEKVKNFQAHARKIRYDFFKKCIRKNHLAGVLVAHHKDDVIETYLMQKKRKSIPSHYGINTEVEIYGIKVVRTLLSYSKEELKKYCIRNHVKYYEDESNFEDHYERNRVRHKIVEKMSEKEKEDIIAEIDEKNRCLKDMQKQIEAYVNKCGKQMSLSTLLEAPINLQTKILRAFILHNSDLISVSEKSLQNALHTFLHHKKGNSKHNINEHYDLCLEYEMILVCENKKEENYAYVLDHVENMETPYFKIGNTGKVIEGVTLHVEDYPITIRNARLDDKIKLRMGTKKVRRFFIDNKISHKERQLWPVVVNCEGKVIFVSGIGCDITHFSNNSTMFVVKC